MCALPQKVWLTFIIVLVPITEVSAEECSVCLAQVATLQTEIQNVNGRYDLLNEEVQVLKQIVMKLATASFHEFYMSSKRSLMQSIVCVVVP